MGKAIKKTLDIEEIRHWHKTFKHDGELFEIRIICSPGKILSGYFTDVEKAIELLPQYDQYQMYFTVNEVKPACSSRRQFNTFMYVSGSATSKNDIERRWWLPIDIDVERPSDVGSTNEEKEYAHKKAGDVYKFLKKIGFPLPIVCDSSSGYHIYYPIDMPNTTECETIIKNFYDVLSNFFTDEKVKIDKVVGNADRIMRLYGSWGRKGRDSEERPHRLSKILTIPNEIVRMSLQQLSDFVAKYTIQNEQQISSYRQRTTNNFDIRQFILDHSIEVAKEMPYGNGGTKFILKECPFDSSHKAPDSAIFVTSQGAIGFKCLHNSCANHDWHELRLMFDPQAYDYENHSQQVHYRQIVPQVPQKPKYQIKDEIPELGEKWLSMSAIKKVDITTLEKVKTGFIELDNKIGGLYMSEITVLSGSNASGKSSWLNSVLLNIVQQGYKVALWSGELRADILKAWIQMVAAGANNLRQSQFDEGRYYVPDTIGERIDRWLDGKFFLYNNEYGNVASQIVNDIKILIKAGVKIFAVDNMMAANIDGFDGDKNDRQKRFILELKDIAMKEKVHIILVAHPRKSIAFLRKNDISGSGDIINAVDNCFIFHRTNEDFLHAIAEFYNEKRREAFRGYGNVLCVEKNRLYGVVDFMCGFYYDMASRRFKNTESENIHYGWEQEPKQGDIAFNTTQGGQLYHQPQETPKIATQMPLNANNSAMASDSDMPFMPNTDSDAPF